jgi:CubicO group peptidase (beta-lactamase class C family)
VAVALIDDQDTVWQEAFGLANIEKDIPATVDTVYKLWSVSKVFTAIETMRLVEEGLVDLDAPIQDYLPDFSIQSRFPEPEPITIRSILSHHSGLPRNECHSMRYIPEGRNVLGELVESMKDCQMAFPVGYRYKYTNIGPVILGYIIQDLRGESFPQYMKENLLTPVGMENSAFISTGIPAQKDVALGYEYYEGEYYPYEQGDITSLPSGNLYSTIEDMSDFTKFVFRGGEAAKEQIINPETLKLMFEVQFSSQRDPQPMGLGWKTARVLGSERMIWHDGGPGEGIGSLVALLPERNLGVVLFANEVSFEGSVSVSLAVEILELMLETKYGVKALYKSAGCRPYG